MSIWYSDQSATVYSGDCLDILPTLAAGSIDAVVTDPPYGLEFMGKDWDGADGFRRRDNPADTGRDTVGGRLSSTSPQYRTGAAFQRWCTDWAQECWRLLKPGGYLVAFGGARTWHRLVCGVEDAGFEIRDSIAWLYSSGYPKSLNVSKALDAAAGVEPRVVATGPAVKRMIPGAEQNRSGSWIKADGREFVPTRTEPVTDAARQWQGWGTALKPGYEPIMIARKPLEGSVANNVAAHGTGAVNIDGCRTPTTDVLNGSGAPPMTFHGTNSRPFHGDAAPTGSEQHDLGRWPANVALDLGQAEMLDAQCGVLASGANPARRGSDKFRSVYSPFAGSQECQPARGADSGGASRFFPTFRYQAKAGSDERPHVDGVQHPTVKPLALMQWLVRLITPPRGLVLDPFAGSGTTIEACITEHLRCIAVERDTDYLPLITARVTKPIAVGFDFEESP